LENDISQKEKTIIGLNNSYGKLENSKDTEIKKLTHQLAQKENQYS
jgi:hypothetical protein